MSAEARLAALLFELEGLSAYFLGRYDDPKVQSGADVVCSAIDLVLTRQERP